MQTCYRCGEDKPLKQFYRLSNLVGKQYSNECKKCRSDRHKEKLLRKYPVCGVCGLEPNTTGLDQCKKCLKESGFKWCRGCQCYRLVELDFYEHKAVCKFCFVSSKKEKSPQLDNRRDSYYRKTYGIGLDDYNYLLELQSGGCGICGEPDRGKSLCVDHCHTTGKVRGLLCFACNTGLGCFKDSPTRINGALSYLATSSNVAGLLHNEHKKSN